MNTVHELRSFTDPTSVPNLADSVNERRVLRWLLPCVAIAVAALAAVAATHLPSDAPTTRRDAVHQLAGPEEQAFINRVGRARLAAAAGSAPVVVASVGQTIDPEERAFLNQLRIARLTGGTGSAPVAPAEKVFVNRT